MKRYFCFVYISFITIILLSSCRTIDLEMVDEDIPEPEEDTESLDFYVEEKLRTQDIEDTVFFVEKVVYRPESELQENDEPVEKTAAGIDTVVESYGQAVVKPEEYKNGAIMYMFDENQVFEVYTEPYQLTDIVLEPGEIVIANPLISEDEQVWELTAGVSKNGSTGDSIQHLFLKPVCSGLDSTFIILTDRRTYHFRIMSFNNVHMAVVRFKFPKTKNDTWNSTSLNTFVSGEMVQASDPDMLSFDYKITYSLFSKPEFLPKRIYDDGRQTYIIVDEIVLHKELPVLFNESEELMNYTVKGNMFIVPRLITKATLRLDGQKVTIEKKKKKKS